MLAEHDGSELDLALKNEMWKKPRENAHFLTSEEVNHIVWK